MARERHRREVRAPSGGGEIIDLMLEDSGENNIILTGGNYTVTLPRDQRLSQVAPEVPAAPTTSYRGVISGEGTITVRVPPGGTGNLRLTNTSTYSLPQAQLRQWMETQPVRRQKFDGLPKAGTMPNSQPVLHGHNAPALTVERGATVQFTDEHDASGAWLVSDLQAVGAPPAADQYPGQANFDAVRVDGTLVISNYRACAACRVLGELSGTGTLINPVGGFTMLGDNSFSGAAMLYSATVGDGALTARLPRARVISSGYELHFGVGLATQGRDPASGSAVVPQTIYENTSGNSLHNEGLGQLTFTGVYSYSDSGRKLAPGLSNPALNYLALPDDSTHRTVDLHDSITVFGGPHFFLPGNPRNLTLHTGAVVGFDFHGPARVNASMNSAADVRGTDVVILGSTVIFTQPQYYNGITKIDPGATLQFGDGTRGHEVAALSVRNPRTGTTVQGYFNDSGGNASIGAPGRPSSTIINNGTLVVDNVPQAVDGVGAISLSNLSGTGALVQRGILPLTLTGPISYTGPTVIERGLLAAGGAGIDASRRVTLSGPGAALDLSQRGEQTVRELSGVSGSRVAIGDHLITLDSTDDRTFAGSITDGGLHPGRAGTVVKDGPGRLVLTGGNPTHGRWEVRRGTLELAGPTGSIQGAVTVRQRATLTGSGTIVGSLEAHGTTVLSVLHPLTVTGPISVTGPLTVTAPATSAAAASAAAATAAAAASSASASASAPTPSVILLNNTGSAPISGTFSGLPEGSPIVAGGMRYALSYQGGTGNDLALIDGVPVNPPPAATPPGGDPSGVRPGVGAPEVRPFTGLLAGTQGPLIALFLFGAFLIVAVAARSVLITSGSAGRRLRRRAPITRSERATSSGRHR